MAALPFCFRIHNTYPHDSKNFTQGLDMEDGVLYEGTGSNGQSRLLETDLNTGASLQAFELAPQYFGEGITILGEEVYHLPQTSKVGFVYDKESFLLARTFNEP